MNKFILGTIIVCSFLFQVAFANLKLFTEPYNHHFRHSSGSYPILNAINNAKNNIDIEIYLLKDKWVLNELVKKAKQGVKIRILLEKTPYNNGKTTSDPAIIKTKNFLEHHGISIKWSNPTFALTHEKAIVIDNHEAFIMTMNLTYSSFHKNREYGVIDNNTNDINEIETVFNADWNRTKPAVTRPNLLWSPVNSRYKMLNLITSAHTAIISENEELNDPEIEQALANAAKTGVDVKLILPQPQTPIPAVTKLRQAGVNIKFLDEAKGQLYMHAKMMVVDQQQAYLGSINISTPSLDQNRELGIFIYAKNHPKIINTLTKIFNFDWNPPHQKIKQVIHQQKPSSHWFW